MPYEQAGAAGGESIFVNRGNLVFEEVSLPTSVQFARLFPADVSDDGLVDILAVESNLNGARMLRNDGP